MEKNQEHQPEDIDTEFQELLEEESIPIREPARRAAKPVKQEESVDAPVTPDSPTPRRWSNW
jgi:hypothetical protein